MYVKKISGLVCLDFCYSFADHLEKRLADSPIRFEMPELTKEPEAGKAKTQPWRAIWPPTSASDVQIERKANCGSGGDSGKFGYNDSGEGIPANPIKTGEGSVAKPNESDKDSVKT